jgi:hypothetical protein
MGTLSGGTEESASPLGASVLAIQKGLHRRLEVPLGIVRRFQIFLASFPRHLTPVA